MACRALYAPSTSDLHPLLPSPDAPLSHAPPQGPCTGLLFTLPGTPFPQNQMTSSSTPSNLCSANTFLPRPFLTTVCPPTSESLSLVPSFIALLTSNTLCNWHIYYTSCWWTVQNVNPMRPGLYFLFALFWPDLFTDASQVSSQYLPYDRLSISTEQLNWMNYSLMIALYLGFRIRILWAGTPNNETPWCHRWWGVMEIHRGWENDWKVVPRTFQL